jgi:UDP-N-acetylglucosamine--dolichyl-phosphate N-acetylglucosaminephosphotransferase
MDPLLYVSIILAFITTFYLTWKWIPVAKRAGLVGKDMNKPSKAEVAEMGGVAVLGGVLGGLLFYIALNTFIFNQVAFNISLFGTMSTILIIAFIGIIDDFLGWKIGLSQWQKPLLTIPAALPMMVINAGHSTMSLPILGVVDFGILYPLLIVPLGIIIASNGFNMLAGYNGLEAGMGIIMLSALSFVAYLTGSSFVAMIGAVTVAALVAFLFFNWYPAKIFPGNGFTYMIGAIIACIAILGNMEKLAIILFIPYIVDFFLKARSKMKAEEFGKVQADGSLLKPYDKYFGLPHVLIDLISKLKGKAFERDVVLTLLLIEVLFALVGLMLYV